MMPSELNRHISALPARGPIAKSRKDGLMGWLAEYNGPGFYKRTNWNHSAKFAYNHIHSADALLWLAEAVGVPRFALLKAKAAARATEPNRPSQAAAVRQVLPWALVEALLKARQPLRAKPRQ